MNDNEETYRDGQWPKPPRNLTTNQDDAISRAVAAERERCKRAVYDATDWAHDERDFALKEAIVEWIDRQPQPSSSKDKGKT